MAIFTGLGEPCLNMVRIGCALKVLQMACHADCVGAGQVVIVVDVALRALHRSVEAGQREPGIVVIEGRA